MRILFALFFSLSAYGQSLQGCGPALSIEDFKQLVNEVREEHFPELINENIRLTTFRSDAYFMQANPMVKTLLGKKAKRIYNLELNLQLLECPPNPEALKGILAHELEHIKDYTRWGTAQIAVHGASYATNLKGRIKYERATDQKTVDMGLGEGLAQYREWIYQRLTPKELQIKRRIYLTPEEIRNQ